MENPEFFPEFSGDDFLAWAQACAYIEFMDSTANTLRKNETLVLGRAYVAHQDGGEAEIIGNPRWARAARRLAAKGLATMRGNGFIGGEWMYCVALTDAGVALARKTF